MSAIKKVLQLVALSVLGFYTYLIIVMYGFSPQFLGNALSAHQGEELRLTVLGGGMWACVIGLLIGLGSLFFDGQKRLWCLFAPVYIPLLYLVGTITYFIA